MVLVRASCAQRKIAISLNLLGLYSAQNFISRLPHGAQAQSQSGQMEVSSLSTSSLPISPYCQPSQYQFVARRPHSVRHRRKRARLQPRPRTSATMSPLPAADLDPTTGETGRTASRAQPAETSSSPAFGRPRRTTVQSDIQDAILHPGNVRINVQGAFIVDEEQPGTPQSEDYEHDPKDIRLPNHTAVVSHIALDVSVSGCRVLDQGAREHYFGSYSHSMRSMLT